MEIDPLTLPEDARLEVIAGVDVGRSFIIDNKTITIGRAEVCEVQLSDQFVSNKHCQVIFRNGHFTAIDLGSLNATRVNDHVYEQRNLTDGNVLSLGKTQLRFVWAGQDAWRAALARDTDD